MKTFWCAAVKRLLYVCLIAGLSMSAAGPACAEGEITKIKAVATFSILGDLVRNVGGDHVDVIVLAGPDTDVHAFEPAPQDSVALTQAQVIFENGLHFEPWIEKLYNSSGARAPRVSVSDGVEPIVSEQGEANPHVWHDIANAMVMVERIRDGLIAADPAHADYYTHNAEEYLGILGKLNLWIIDTLREIPDERRKITVTHDSFTYFGKRYGFDIIGAGLEPMSTEAADPSAADMARLADALKTAGIKVVFTENMTNPKIMEAVAAEVGARVAPPLYTDALGAAGSPADTYVNLVKHNVNTLAEHLKSL